jgi:osmotically-inducible protein OsmY
VARDLSDRRQELGIGLALCVVVVVERRSVLAGAAALQEAEMKRMVRSSGLVGAIAVVLVTAACSDRDRTDGRASEAARDAGRAASDSTRAAGDAVGNAGRAADAAVETMDVKAALMADSRVESGEINVDTDHQTKTVFLKGHVPTEAQKQIAEQIAVEKAVGYRVTNQLTVGR